MANTPYIIGIAGPSGSGKTLLAKYLAEKSFVCDAIVISMDSYYRDLSALASDKRRNFNFDSPKAIDHQLFAKHLQALLKGKEIKLPIYNFATHTRDKSSTALILNKSFIIIEGMFALYWKNIRQLFQTGVFIVTDDQICLSRRITRDVNSRNRTKNSVIKQYHETVYPMFKRYILPTKSFADLAVSGDLPIECSAEAIIKFIKKQGVVENSALKI